MRPGSGLFQPLKLGSCAAKPSDATQPFVPQILQVESHPSTLETVFGSSSFHALTVASMMFACLLNNRPQPLHPRLLLLSPGELDVLVLI